MTKEELRDYGNWVGRTAEEVRDAAIRRGGWPHVFPGGLPRSMEIHRVRNYFNELPNTLIWLREEQARAWLRKVTYYKGDRLKKFVRGEEWKAATALTGLVFTDGRGRPWYHMDPAGAAYHIGDGEGGFFDKARGVLFPNTMPLKLVSPDGWTGGSHEVIVEAKSWKLVPGRPFPFAIVGDVATQGSYNYGETVTSGTGFHTLLDVNPHVRDKRYVSPQLGGIGTPLDRRSFPRL